jgi:hypothetical protein
MFLQVFRVANQILKMTGYMFQVNPLAFHPYIFWVIYRYRSGDAVGFSMLCDRACSNDHIYQVFLMCVDPMFGE